MPRPDPNSSSDQRSSTIEPQGGGRPARHVERRARSPHGGYQSGDALLPELPTLGEIERRIMRCDDELADLVEQHYYAAEEAASAEADWKQHRDRCLLVVANASEFEAEKIAASKSQDLREAYAKSMPTHPYDEGNTELGEDLYRTYKILAARETSIDRHIKAVQTRATALMSVARGIRQASGL